MPEKMSDDAYTALNWDHPRWYGQDGADLFEEFCTELLRSLGFRNVDWRKGHPDEGWDIEAKCGVTHPGGTRDELWYVQCKRYSQNTGVPAIKIDTKRIEMLPLKPDCLLLMTNSYFLPKVKDWARAPHPFRVELWEGGTIESLTLRHANLLERYFPETAGRLKDDCVSRLVHILRSSLQWLYSEISWTQAVATREVQVEDYDVKEAFTRLRGVSEHVNTQIERFGLTYMMDYDRISIDVADVDVAKLIADAVKCLTWFERGTNVTVAIDGPEHLNIQGDTRALRILLTDVIDNALKYSFSGTKVSVSLGRSDPDGFITIAVSNCGVGIPPEEIKKVFEKYYRGHHRDVRMFVSGLGVGLTLCKRIVEEHRGTISLESEPVGKVSDGEGERWFTRCTIGLPFNRGTNDVD